MNALIVGAGTAGLTAGVLLKRKGWDVQIMESRTHIGGNCWDYDHNGTLVHAYGPHIFHTNSQRVFMFVNEFGGLTGYQHRVKANVVMYTNNGGERHERLLSIPYSLVTEQELGAPLDDEQIVKLFFRDDSEKMWGRPFDQIPNSITGRVPKRRPDFDDRYFTDEYQGMPTAGYTEMFNRMADEIGLTNVHLGVRRNAWRLWADGADLVVYTGPVDDFYDQSQGVLPYRSIKFDFRLAQPRGVHSVINWCDTRPCTRTTDYACFYDKPATTTVLGDEYPQDYCPWEGLMPSYPMRGFPEADAIMARYDALSPGPNTLLCGRLGAYRYMNMDQVISDTMFKLESKLGGSVY